MFKDKKLLKYFVQFLISVLLLQLSFLAEQRFLKNTPQQQQDTYVRLQETIRNKELSLVKSYQKLLKDTANYDEIVYECYAPHGVAVLVETATDNPTRTVANVRMHFTKGDGALGTSGSVAFTFNRMGEFKVKNAGLNTDDLELELIDFGLEEIGEDAEGNIIIRTAFTEFGNMSKALEEKGIEVITAELTRIPLNTVELGEEQANDVLKMIDKLEQDDDVQKVYHNLK